MTAYLGRRYTNFRDSLLRSYATEQQRFQAYKIGTVAKYRVEQVGLNWSDVSKKLTENAWAKQINSTEMRLEADLDTTKDAMSEVFGNAFPKILPILQQAHEDQKGQYKQYIDEKFLDLLDKARQAKINIVLGTAFISAGEKIIAHARRGVTSSERGYACTIGQWLIEHLKTTEEVTNFILNEALHFGNTKPHGKIISPEDYNTVVEHGITDDPSFSYSYNLKETALEAMVDHGPWQPLYGGKIVGKSAKMVRLFKQIDAIKKDRKRTPVLIVGPTGSGKTTIAETFTPQEYYSLNAGLLSTMPTSDMIDILVENIQRANKTSCTLIINNFEKASAGLQSILLACLDGKSITDRKATSISVNCRIVITTTQTTHLEDAFLSRLQGTTLKIPDRAEDIVLLAEYFNWELSKEYNIPWAPLDKFVGQILQDTKVAQEWGYNIKGIQSIMREIIINRLQIFSGTSTIKKPDDLS